MRDGRKISRDAAINSLKRLFGSTSSDYVSVEEIFTNTGRDHFPLSKNRTWLYNVLSSIKPYDFFEKERGAENGVSVTKGIRLTSEGRYALRGNSATPPPKEEGKSDGRQVSFASVRADVKRLKALHPEFNVVFTATLKEDE